MPIRFFLPAHGNISDCLAGTHILAGNLPRSGQSVMKALLDRAEKKTIRIWAVGSRIELKDILKAHGYTWPGDTGLHKAWYIDVDEDQQQAEMDFLYARILRRKVPLPTQTIDRFKRFSDRT